MNERRHGALEGILEVYEYRYVMYSLVHKELFGKYKNSFFGFFGTSSNPCL